MRRTDLGAHLTAAALIVALAATGCERERGVVPGVAGSASVQQVAVSEAFFKGEDPRRIRIEIGAEGTRSLERHPRRAIRAVVHEGGATFRDVAVHLKGGKGSFRPISQRPALTLDFDRFAAGRRFYGMERIHLNNSVEDATRCDEIIASETMRLAGVPAARATLARVTIDGRDVGLYVLKEGIDRRFLKLYFRDPDGGLYEGSAMEDVGALAGKDNLRTTAEGDLEALSAAAKERDLAARFRRLAELVDVDRFVSYIVLEAMLGATDGYAMNTNNYRLYFDPTSRRFVFLPGGLDQLFVESTELYPEIGGDVALGLVETEPGRRLYDERMAALFGTLFRRDRIVEIVRRTAARAHRLLLPQERPEYDLAIEDLVRRVDSRFALIERHLAARRSSP